MRAFGGNRRIGRIALVAVALLAMSGCGELLVDAQTNEVKSPTTFQVSPTTVTVDGAPVTALDMTFRNCALLKFTNLPPDIEPGTFYEDDWTLTDSAQVLAADESVVYSENPFFAQPLPPGFSKTTGTTTHIVLPVDPTLGPFTIDAGCTTYVGGTAPFWGVSFPQCVTVNLACDAQKGTYFFNSPF